MSPLSMMPQTVHTYLPQQHDGPRQFKDSEAAAALTRLPPDTPVYRYQSMPQMEATARTVDNESGLCVFLDVPERIVGDDRELLPFKTITFYPTSKTLIAKMPRRPHEVATEWLHDKIVGDILRDMGMRSISQLKSIGSATIDHKEADYTVQPKRLPRGRSRKWPSLVVETGFTETHGKLAADADWWLRQSNGDVKVVITIKVSKTKVTIRRWGGQAVLKQEIVMRKHNRRPATITGAPLRIPFRDLFLRDPVRNQGDLIFRQEDLEEWAEAIWEEY